ncbi:uncharacterized protein LOC129585821 [Paramacrobiotus metropolitanus]|uniref:uncharacterized protein LOC129585821 n=1 Tax=Paramacrobiotus metropolitanus TaxID=2943436 RepID=UPI002445ACA7|nr:uncharacterized protein LOC129585821 [Paramacrobiotus metropolitanus]
MQASRSVEEPLRGNSTASGIPETEETQDTSHETPLSDPPDPDRTPWITTATWPRHQHWFRKGDLVEFHRQGQWFNHWGLYMDNGLVAHVTRHDILQASMFALGASRTASTVLASESATASQLLSSATMFVAFGERMLLPSPPPTQEQRGHYFVRLDNILLVAEGDKFRVNNFVNGTRFVQRSWPEIFDLVSSLVNNPYAYSVFTSNCEHFATFLRYRWNSNGSPAANPQNSHGISGR